MVYGVIGNGAQAEFRALGFMMLMGISEFRAFDVNAVATTKLVRNMAGVNAIRIISAKSTRGRLTVPISSQPAPWIKINATILTPDSVEPGMHTKGLGGDCPRQDQAAS